MSIKVQDLTKTFGEQNAVDQISFEAHQGEVLGFLGPNGAGKTTTMRIISCFIPPTSGKVDVCGHDVLEHPMEVRAQIGYLPENNPLYKDMYVREYLHFVGRLHKVPNRKQRVEAMIERTGLEREQKKLIGQLSKGYRQRVGLAQAMLHDPAVLILDEPTSGLDPNQLIEIRRLIKELGKEKTVIFSTHIMQEVQALCDRIVIINRGKLVADGTMDELAEQVGDRQHLVLELGRSVEAKALQQIDGVLQVTAQGDQQWLLQVDGSADVRPKVAKWAADQGVPLLELHRTERNMEQIFQALTA
ncbi:MAG: gliding motility-associated ABC transporter ATP-binding subunit GldA [Phaeodactylibacter sp.]|nr:gliding motility-associated ABC transporter ATP-binding subunit GldA [Phaeodactylibacter sp.]